MQPQLVAVAQVVRLLAHLPGRAFFSCSYYACPLMAGYRTCDIGRLEREGCIVYVSISFIIWLRANPADRHTGRVGPGSHPDHPVRF